MIEIKNRLTGQVIFKGEAADLRALLEAAVASPANLRGANLGGANLYGANLRGANLGEANLRGANLGEANLYEANLGGANLYGANLRGANLGEANLYGANLGEANLGGANLGEANLGGANLYGANLRGANLGGANLRGANLYGANLRKTKINWNHHSIVAEILRQAAGDNVGHRKVAGLVLISTDWCWPQFMRLQSSRHWAWAVEQLAPYVQDGDNAPEFLRERATEIQAAQEPK